MKTVLVFAALILAGLAPAALAPFTPFAAGASYAADYSIALDGAQADPPVNTPAQGAGTLHVDDDNILHYDITISGLTGFETETHIHGPIIDDEWPGGIKIWLNWGPNKTGTFGPLSDAAIADLDAGTWYVLVHTIESPAGEIRGQILKTPVSSQDQSFGSVKARYRPGP